MQQFSNNGRQRISGAIQAAERMTSGEIVAVVAARSDAYFYMPFLVAGIAALFVPWLLIYGTTWSLTAIYVTQLLVFASVVGALYPLSNRLLLVPGSIKRLHAKRRATEQFFTQNLHTTKSRTGVLIFVSVAERYVQILADKEIDAKVPAGTWQTIVDKLVSEIRNDRAAEGFVWAVESIGQHLAQHFPPDSHDPNELPDHLIVLD